MFTYATTLHIAYFFMYFLRILIILDSYERLARRIEHNISTETILLQNAYTGRWCGGRLDSFSSTPSKAYCTAVLRCILDQLRVLGWFGIWYYCTIGWFYIVLLSSISALPCWWEELVLIVERVSSVGVMNGSSLTLTCVSVSTFCTRVVVLLFVLAAAVRAVGFLARLLFQRWYRYAPWS